MDNSNLTALSPEDLEILQEYIQSINEINLLQFSLIAITVLSIYEAILTFPQEVKYIYDKKFGLTSLLYLLTRYCPIAIFLLETIINFLLTFDLNYLGPGRFGGQILPALLSVGGLIGVQGLWGTRLYAISSGKKIWAIFLLILFVITVGLNIAGGITVNELDANGQLTIANKVVSTLQNVLVTVYDSIVFVGTVYYTFGTWRLQKKTALKSANAIPVLLLEQGLVRYLLIVLLNVTTIVLNLVPISSAESSIGGFFQNCLSSIFLCRLTLEFRERNEKRIDDVQLPTLTFSIRSIRDTGRYIHQTLIAEGHGQLDIVDEENIPTQHEDEEDSDDIIDIAETSSSEGGVSMV